MNRLLGVGGLLVGLLLPTAALANGPGTLTLDSYYGWSRDHTPPVSTSYILPRHARYVVTVSGTLSYYPAIDYSRPQPPWTMVCGAPDPATEFGGSRGGNGPVGFDAEFIFARPSRRRMCSRYPLPRHWSAFQVNAGTGWQHPGIVGTYPIAPSASHTYTYAIVGHGRRVQFRLYDVYTRDNYGILRIELRPAVVGDCTSYVALKFTSVANCQAQVAGNLTRP